MESEAVACCYQNIGHRVESAAFYLTRWNAVISGDIVLYRAIAGDGGEGEIRTHGGLAPTPVFKTGALNHSATSPHGAMATRFCRNAQA